MKTSSPHHHLTSLPAAWTSQLPPYGWSLASLHADPYCSVFEAGHGPDAACEQKPAGEYLQK